MALYGKRVFKHVDDLNALVPQATRSYSPIAFSELTELVEDRSNLYFDKKPKSFDFTTDKTGNKQFGVFTYENPANEQLDYMIGYRSSYDKSLSNQFCAGGSVLVCDNMMFVGDIYTSRKHTTYMKNELVDKIDSMLDRVMDTFADLEEDIEAMKTSIINDKKAAKMLGELTFHKRLIGSSTANSAMRAWKKSKYDGSGYYDEKNVWRLYNAITEQTRHANPMNSFKIKDVHTHLIKNYV
tara:strand:+ start:772 stop:1491 length:720 start_codon:yes stop_codon:yes gene_type:complete